MSTMSGIFKIFLLLAVTVCISKAQNIQRCMCPVVRNGIASRPDIKDIQVYPATNFCGKVEIVVTNKSGLRYCLNPEQNNVKRLVALIMQKKNSPTVRPTEVTSKKHMESGNSPAWCEI